MKKIIKTLKIFTFIFGIFFCMNSVSASTCSYGYYSGDLEGKNNKNISWEPTNQYNLTNKKWNSGVYIFNFQSDRIELLFDSSAVKGNAIEEENFGQLEDGNYFTEYDVKYELNWKDTYYTNLLKPQLSYIEKSCPDVLIVCGVYDRYNNESYSSEDNKHYFYLDAMGKYMSQDGNSLTHPWEGIIGHSKNVACFYYAEENVKDTVVLETSCYTYNRGMDDLKSIVATNGCSSEEFDNRQAELYEECKYYLDNQNYSQINEDGEIFARACSTACSNLTTDVNAICLGEEPDEKPQEYACGSLGVKLVNWIFRILKIIRYIVPVLVILLGIIDFMKAISSGSDDEMKKAGAKFIKRLIAAALIFIIPFLLEFIFNIINVPGLNTNNAYCQN